MTTSRRVRLASTLAWNAADLLHLLAPVLLHELHSPHARLAGSILLALSKRAAERRR